MLRTAVRQWMQDSNAHSVEIRLASLCSLLAGLLLRNRVASSVFLAAVPIGTIIFATWSEYSVRRWSVPFRKGARGGLALGSTIVPLLLVAACSCAETHKARNLGALYYYICLLSVCSLVSMISTVCWLAPPPNHYGLVAFSSVLLSAVGYGFLPDIMPSFWWLLLPVWTYMVVTAVLFSMLPQSFSAGEGVIVSQAIFLLFFDVGLHTIRRLGVLDVPRIFVYSRGTVPLACEVLVAYALLVGVFIVWPWQSMSSSPPRVLQSLVSSTQRWSSVIWLAIVTSAIFFLLPWLQLVMNVSIVIWLFQFLLSPTRLILLAYWLVCLVVAGVIVIRGHSQRKQIAADKWQLMVARKKFHLLAVAIYVPGLLLDQEMMMLASGIAMCTFIILEYIRALRIWPIGAQLNVYLLSFVDGRDSGTAILTHIYLLLGFALPCFAYPLSHFRSAPKLATYAGVLALGFGDAAASLCGMKWGRRQWPRMDKTVEGTLASVVVQLVVCYCLYMLDSHLSAMSMQSWCLVAAAVVAGSLMEAFTGQVDNLVLPPYLFSLLVLIKNTY